MKRNVLVLAGFAVLVMVASSAWAFDGPSVRYDANYGGHGAAIHQVRHPGPPPGHRYGHPYGCAPRIVVPVPAYGYYPPPPVVYPAPVYAVPRSYYYGRPGNYFQYQGRGLSLGIGF